METFFKTIEDLSGQSCEGLTAKEAGNLILFHCPEFYESPKKFFLSLMEALPDSKDAWRSGFITLFVFSNFADERISNFKDKK